MITTILSAIVTVHMLKPRRVRTRWRLAEDPDLPGYWWEKVQD